MEALHVRIDRLRKVKAKEAPILYCEGACGIRLDPEEYVFDKIFGHKRASISLGYIGLHEAMEALYPDTPHIFDNKVKQETALKVVKMLKDRTKLESDKYDLGFGVYSTPSESLCDRFCRLDQEKFGDLPFFEKGYYTNSFHLDVECKTSPMGKINFEMEYPKYASSGFISFVELPSVRHNLKALETIWNYTYDKVPYFGINLPIDQCFECGFQGEAKPTSKGFECPSCGNHNSDTLSVIKRVCGYLGAPNARPFNPGKQSEVIKRVKHANN